MRLQHMLIKDLIANMGQIGVRDFSELNARLVSNKNMGQVFEDNQR